MTAWAAIDPGGSGSADNTPDKPMLAIGCSRAEYGLTQQIPGCNLSERDSIWRAPLSWASYVCFKTVWASQPVDESPALQKWAADAWERVQRQYALRAAMDASPRVRSELMDIEGGKALFPFQRGGVEWLADLRRAILNDPQGNGKTPQVIRTIQVLARRGREQALPALIICAGAMLLSWQRELSIWAPELKVEIVAGTALRRRQALEREADVYVIAWDNVRSHTRLAAYPGQRFVRCEQHGGVADIKVARCEVHEKELNLKRWQTVIADEAHRMRNPHSKWTRAVWWLAHHAENFWPITGTLIGDTIDDLWPILHAIDPKYAPARSRYLDLFAIKELAWHQGVEILGIKPETAAAFHAIAQPMIRRIPKELARPQMPARMPPVYRYPEMTPAQAKLYRQLRKESLADLAQQTIVPANTAVKFGRMCQLAASSIVVEDGEDRDGFTREVVRLELPSNKATDLLDFLGDNPGQLVVSAWSPALVELCEKKLSEAKITHCKIVGGMSYAQQDQSVQWFQNGDCRVIFITAAGSESITLTAASTIFFLQPDPSYISTEQKIGRVDRIGQTDAVKVVYSLTPGTTDIRLHQLSLDKGERAAQVTSDPELMKWIIESEGEDLVEEAQRPASGTGQGQLF